MKQLLPLILVFFSFQADANVISALKKVFPQSEYIGITPAGEGCYLRFEYSAKSVTITSSTDSLTVSRVALVNSGYRLNAGRREVLSSDKKSTFRSLAIDEITTYTVTSEINDSGEEVPVECIVTE